MPPKKSEKFDDMPYYPCLRDGLHLFFSVETKQAVFYNYCRNRNSRCNQQNCYYSYGGRYQYCPHISFSCPRCQRTLGVGQFQIDHKFPVAAYLDAVKRSGTYNHGAALAWYNKTDNLQILCSICNQKKGSGPDPLPK